MFVTEAKGVSAGDDVGPILLRAAFAGLALWLMFAAWAQRDLERPEPLVVAKAAAGWVEALPTMDWSLLISLLGLTTALWLWSEIILSRLDRWLRRRRLRARAAAADPLFVANRAAQRNPND